MSNSPLHKPSWTMLEKHAAKAKAVHLNDIFAKDPKRFENFSLDFDSLFFDFSKQRLDKDIFSTLINLAEECQIEQRRDAMFRGDKINTTEDRAVLHTALRAPKDKKITLDGHDIAQDIHQTLNKMRALSENIRSGKYKGSTEKSIKNIVSIGIGGSDFGPHLVCKALENEADNQANNPAVYFVSNIDAHDITKIFKKCDPETTLFIVISKSFQTQDTLINAQSAFDWLKAHLPDGANISQHFIGVSANKEAALSFGILEDNFLPIWDWVNGRFSLWSAVGLPICMAFGFDVFRNLLDGAYKMDEHFCSAPLNKNLPVLMALIGIWNRNFLGAGTLAILPYSQNLFFLPAYLRQLDMESNGKNIDLDGNKITGYQTGPVIFGEAGTNGQHSFYQLLHQGTDLIASDFIGVINPKHDLPKHHDLLLSHMLSQTQALMQGRQIDGQPHCHFDGNKPCSTILINRLNAHHLGMLLALYEHKVFVQGAIWNINSFDQFGVELGKELSHKIENNDLGTADSSTRGLFSLIHKEQ